MRNVCALFDPVIANYREREYCLFATKQSKQIPLRDSRMQRLLWAALFLMVAMDEIWIHKQSVKKTKKKKITERAKETLKSANAKKIVALIGK